MPRYERIDGADRTFAILVNETGAPELLYFGPQLSGSADLAEMAAILQPGQRESLPDHPVAPSLCPTNGFGWMGEPAISGVHDGADGALNWSSADVECTSDSLEVTLRDDRTGLEVRLSYWLDSPSGVLTSRMRLTNHGARPFRLHQAMSVCLPLPAWVKEAVSLSGDWSREGQLARIPLSPGIWSQTNRTGRTGFSGSTLMAGEPAASDHAGRLIAIHLAWSGNHELSIETLASGRRLAMAGAHLAPGEVVLTTGASYETPEAHLCLSETGFNGVSDAFHPFVRTRILPDAAGPRAVRRVHFNTWEAAYFDVDEASMKEVAAAAAAVGVERFILDDGWFAGRRNDSSSLGDWRADPVRFRHGLGPLIDAVRALGMDFGLWIEPEMVSPDSDLYRAHPDWCLHAPGAPRPGMRHQLWLDMAREEVRDHIFEQISALLSGNAIACIKWDCNRFMFPAVSAGAPAAGRVVRGTYDLMDRLRAAHPSVEIESCASGGARMDLAVLKRASRLWPSDATDALERIRIQRCASLIFPPEIIGAHVGPAPNPVTGRHLPMALRSRIAMFGHMGVEADPRRLSSEDRDTLSAHIALYKRYRPLLHSGRMLRWRTDDGAEAVISLSPDGGEALCLICRSDTAPEAEAAPVMIPGLATSASYRITLPEPWPAIASRRLHDPAAWRRGRVISADILSQAGLRLPLSDPMTAWLVHLERV